MNNQSNINLKIIAISIVGLIVGAYVLFNKTPESDQALSVESTNHKADAPKMKDKHLITPEKETEQSISSASIQKSESDEQNTKKSNEQTNKRTNKQAKTTTSRQP